MLAHSLAKAGRCPEAVVAQRRTRELVDFLSGTEAFDDAARRLTSYEAGCADSSVPTAAELDLPRQVRRLLD